MLRWRMINNSELNAFKTEIVRLLKVQRLRMITRIQMSASLFFVGIYILGMGVYMVRVQVQA
jgi:hypothetical protein